MKISFLFYIVVLLFSPVSFSAFNEKENSQLKKIDNSSVLSLNSSNSKLNSAIDSAMLDNPEKKQAILALKKSWVKFIKSKCDFESFESKGTDAETSTFNQCLVNENEKAISYFTHLLP